MTDYRRTAEGLLAVDVDGTLLTDTGAITDTVYQALERTVSAGWEIVLASGRTFYAARTIIEQLPFVRYAVLSNGACIMDVREKRILRMETLSPGVVETIVTITRQNGAIPALYNTDMFSQKVYYDTLEGACSFFTWYVTEDKRCVRIDADMISGADVGVAMGNAPDEIKKLAHEVVGSNNGSGLAEAVERIVLNEMYFTGA